MRYVRRELSRRARRQLLIGTLYLLFYSPCLFSWYVQILAGQSVGGALGAMLLYLPVGLAGLFLVGLGVSGYLHAYRHPDLLALDRYGPHRDILRDIEGELGDGRRVRRLGDRRVTIASYFAGELFLTASWLLYVTGDEPTRSTGYYLASIRSWWRWLRDFKGIRFFAMRFDSVVEVRRTAETLLNVPEDLLVSGAVIIVDRFDEELEIPGRSDGLARLMMELVARTPQAFTRFELDALPTPLESSEERIERQEC